MNQMFDKITSLSSTICGVYDAKIPMAYHDVPKYVLIPISRRLYTMENTDTYGIESCMTIRNQEGNVEVFFIIVNDEASKIRWGGYVDTALSPLGNQVIVASIGSEIFNGDPLVTVIEDLYNLYMGVVRLDPGLQYEPSDPSFVDLVIENDITVPTYDAEMFYLVIYLINTFLNDRFVREDEANKLNPNFANFLKGKYGDGIVAPLEELFEKVGNESLNNIYGNGGFCSYAYFS